MCLSWGARDPPPPQALRPTPTFKDWWPNCSWGAGGGGRGAGGGTDKQGGGPTVIPAKQQVSVESCFGIVLDYSIPPSQRGDEWMGWGWGLGPMERGKVLYGP